MPTKYPSEYHRMWRGRKGMYYALRSNEKVRLYQKTVFGRLALKAGNINVTAKMRIGAECGKVTQSELYDLWIQQGGELHGDKITNEPLCAICSVGLDTFGQQGMIIDHILSLREGGKNTRKNLRLLCIDCHKKKTRKEQNRKSPWYQKRGDEIESVENIVEQQTILKI